MRTGRAHEGGWHVWVWVGMVGGTVVGRELVWAVERRGRVGCTRWCDDRVAGQCGRVARRRQRVWAGGCVCGWHGDSGGQVSGGGWYVSSTFTFWCHAESARSGFEKVCSYSLASPVTTAGNATLPVTT